MDRTDPTADKAEAARNGIPTGPALFKQRAPVPAPLEDTTLLVIGISLALGSGFLMLFGMYAVIVSSAMPATGWTILDTLNRDEHYKYLVPLIIPAGLVAVIVNWGGLHYFRHA